jgi:FKBP-type peptidyl-prolyl cis-trans isomerase FklB
MTTNAQIHHEHQFAHSYGVMAGYEFEKNQIPYDKVPKASLALGIKDRVQGLGKMTDVRAADIVQTLEKRTNSVQNQNTTTYNNATTDFASVGYAYGILIGANWKTYGIRMSQSNLNAFLGGVESVFEDKANAMSKEAAQTMVLEQYKFLQEEKKTAKLRKNKAFWEHNKARAGVLTLDNGIQYEILRDAQGAPIGQTDQRLRIKYIGKLTDGTVFDDASNAPIVVTLNSILSGWKHVLPLMRENQTIKAYIPPSLGYGEQARGEVPANSILVYEITLIELLD